MLAERHYQGEAGRRYHTEKRGLPETALPWLARARAEKFASHLTGTEAILEYGVGLGWNLMALDCTRKLGFDVQDFLPPAAREAGVEFLPDTSVLGPGTIDLVICHHTLEHVLEPSSVLREIKRLLVPGGKLLLQVPQERGLKYNRHDANEPNHHLYSWNAQTLGNLLGEVGFTVNEAGTRLFGYDRFAAAWATKLRLGEKGFRALRALLLTLRPLREVRIVAAKP